MKITENIHDLEGADRAKHLAEVLYARMEFDGKTSSEEDGMERIRMEIAEAGWEDVTPDDVRNEISTISGFMRDLGPEGYINAIRDKLKREFGIEFPEKPGRKIDGGELIAIVWREGQAIYTLARDFALHDGRVLNAGTEIIFSHCRNGAVSLSCPQYGDLGATVGVAEYAIYISDYDIGDFVVE